MRKAQMELIGLAFVVVVMVLGLLLYLAFAALPQGAESNPQAVREARDYGSALQTAMLATNIESCGYDLTTAFRNCVIASHLSCGTQGLVCQVTETAWKEMLDATIGYSNVPYVARIENTNGVLFQQGFEHEKDCVGERRLAGPSQQIPTSFGNLRFVISFCQ